MDTLTHTGEVVWDGPYAYGKLVLVAMGIRKWTAHKAYGENTYSYVAITYIGRNI